MDHVLQEGLVMMGVFIVIHSLSLSVIRRSSIFLFFLFFVFVFVFCFFTFGMCLEKKKKEKNKTKLDRQHCCGALFEVNPLPEHDFDGKVLFPLR